MSTQQTVALENFLELEEANGGEAAKENAENEDDILWSLWSNYFFVSGGLCYVVASSWDMTNPPGDGTDENTWVIYNSLWTLGPLVYLCNSVIDVWWAWRVKAREKERRRQRKMLQQSILPPDEIDDPLKKKKKTLLSKLKPKTKKLFRRIRKHVGHRRDLSAAVSFGVAAAFGLVASLKPFITSMGDTTTERLEILSVHCYLVSAFFALCGRRAKPVAGTNWCSLSTIWLNADRLEDLGDAFFGIGSTVDVILCNLHFDDNYNVWPVVSALLWLLDAFFYLRSDFVTMYSQTADYKEFDTGDEDITMSDAASINTSNNISGSNNVSNAYFISP